MNDISAIETKLAAARTRLILEKPFLGSLVMHLPLRAANVKWCKTTATDAKNFYYNPDYIGRLSLEQTQFVLAHEAMHCALSHFARRNHRQKHRWDVACDYAVNMILDDERMHGPENALLNAAYRGLTAEEIYPVLHEDPPEETQDQHLFDPASEEQGAEGVLLPPFQGEGRGGDGQARDEGGGSSTDGQETSSGQSQAAGEPEDASPLDSGRLDEQWKSRLAAAAQSARQAGRLSPSLMRLIDHQLAPQLPWRALLARYMTSAARDDYSWKQTSRRESAALMPRLSSQSVDVIVALDTSGSVREDELRAFLSEIDALKGQVRAAITLHACDEKLDAQGPWHFAAWESVRLPESLRGGGGTDFRPMFEWVEREHLRPDLLLYFTDAQGRFPPQEPPYPVVWLVKGKAGVPFGARVQLN